MAERPIRVFGDPVLKTVSDAVRPGDPRVSGLIDDLLDSVRVPGRAGVAACQIGVNLRAFSYNIDGVVGYVINPVLVAVGGEASFVEEGCLSVPGFFFPRQRYAFARVEGIDLEGHPIEVSGHGLMAQALQHETDHLDGHLFIEGLDKETKRDAMQRIRESDWF